MSVFKDDVIFHEDIEKIYESLYWGDGTDLRDFDIHKDEFEGFPLKKPKNRLNTNMYTVYGLYRNHCETLKRSK